MMKRKRFKLLSFLLITTILAACSTTNDVVSDRRVQKRKYNKGFFFDFDKKWANGTEQANVEAEIKTNQIEPEEELSNTQSITEEVDVVQEKWVDMMESPESPNLQQTEGSDNSVIDRAINADSKDNKIDEKPVRKEMGGLKNPVKEIYKIKSKKKTSSTSGSSSGIPIILLVIVAFIFPWLAVGLYTDWNTMKTLIAVLLWLLFWLPGVIYALLVIFEWI